MQFFPAKKKYHIIETNLFNKNIFFESLENLCFKNTNAFYNATTLINTECYKMGFVSAICFFCISIQYQFPFACYISLDMLYTFIKLALAILQKQDNQIKPRQNLPGLT